MGIYLFLAEMATEAGVPWFNNVGDYFSRERYISNKVKNRG
ncbi:MAG: hypothetical protein ACI9H8_002190 [Lysobacterales bacterium]|jgi:hypothetical protein